MSTVNLQALSSIGAFAAGALQAAKYVKQQGYDDTHFVSLVVNEIQDLTSSNGPAQGSQIIGGQNVEGATFFAAQSYAQQNSGPSGNSRA